MPVNSMVFDREMVRERDVTEEQILRAFRRLVRAILRRIVFRTPVADPGTEHPGQARGNWFLSKARRLPNRFDPTSLDRNGARTVVRAEPGIADLKLGDTAYIYNNVPYIRWLEDGNSTKAPAGMVALALNNVQAGEFT